MTDAAEDRWSAARYAASARFVSDLGAPLVDLLAPEPGQRILDLGCGDGALTAEIAARGADVVGVDASADMVAAARARGLDARVARGEALDVGRGAFDAVFSNAAMHWMTDQRAVVDGVARALRPGGRFVGEFGGRGNVAALRVALVSALASEAEIVTDLSEFWRFPCDARFGALLAEAGFRVDEIALFPRPTPIDDLGVWFETLAAPLLALAPATRREAVLRRASALAGLGLGAADDAAGIAIDYVRLRFAATLERAP